MQITFITRKSVKTALHESEASYTLTSYCRIDQSGFAAKERHLYCYVHVAAENKHILPFGSLDSFWITRSQRSRLRDKVL